MMVMETKYSMIGTYGTTNARNDWDFPLAFSFPDSLNILDFFNLEILQIYDSAFNIRKLENK